MKLVHPYLEEPIEFFENENNILVIEDPNLFTRMVGELKNQMTGGEGHFILSEDQKILPLDKGIDLIIDFFMLTLNQRKILTKLYANLNEKACGEDFYMQTMEITSKLNCYLSELVDTLPYPLKFDEEINPTGLFKMTELLIVEDEKSLVERIVDYLQVMEDFCNIHCFIMVNLKSWLTQEDLKAFYQFVSYNKIKVLLIENIDREERLISEKYRIIDKDWCII